MVYNINMEREEVWIIYCVHKDGTRTAMHAFTDELKAKKWMQMRMPYVSGPLNLTLTIDVLPITK